MKDILVIADPIGCSEDDKQLAFNRAYELAMLSDANIHIVVFCYESISLSSVNEPENNSFSLESVLLENREHWWSAFIKNNQNDIFTTFEVVWEKYPHNWILDHCDTHHYDLIVKTGHRSETPFYTPTDWLLFRKSSVPVYCVTENHFEAKKNVLVALDLMTNSEEKQALNKRLLETAFQISVQTASQLHCCFAIKIPTLVKELELIDTSAHSIRVEKEAREKNQTWLDDYDIDKPFIHIEQGTPWQVIGSMSHQIKAHCIVIGSAGRSGVAGKLIGNTAEKVIHHAKTDILVINPCQNNTN